MVKAMDKMRYPRKKGYAGRYVRHELGKNKLNLLLGCVFLLGALVGCQLAGQDPETILSQLGSLFAATGQSAGFLDTVVASFAANAALLNNFEIVATSLIALGLFGERISPRLWGAIVLVTVASMVLSVEDRSSFSFSTGSVLVLLACTCWGLENNCTRSISHKDPLEIVAIKGFGSGAGSLVIALTLGERPGPPAAMLWALVLGFVAYGLSIFFYIYAQRDLGAAKTSAYYALAPFIGAGLSLLIFRQKPDAVFLTALVIMMAGTWLASTDHAA